MKSRLTCSNLFLLGLLLFSSWVEAGSGYRPPVGIPDPGFGIDAVRPQRPAVWATEVVGYYYVHRAAPGCSDSRVFGHPQSPRCTLPKPIPPGSYVEVHGVYDHTTGGTTDIAGNGTAEAWQADRSGPAWVVGLESDPPVFTQRTVLTGRHLYIDGIRARWSAENACIRVSSFPGQAPTEHIVVRNSVIEGDRKSRTFAVMVDGQGAEASVSRVVVYNNLMYHHGDMTAGDQDADALNAGNHASHVWFLKNTVHTTSGSGGWAGGAYGGADNCHHIYFGDNHIFNTRQSGLSVKYATDVVFSQNHIHDIVDTSWSPSKGIGYQYAPQRLWMLFNVIHGARYGIYGGSTEPGEQFIYAISNLIYGIHAPGAYGGGSWDEAGIMMQGGRVIVIVQNTLADCDAGINGPAEGVSYILENNIVTDVAQEKGNHVFIENASSNALLRNCILHQSGGRERVRWGNKTYDLEGFRAASGKGQNCLNADPGFVGASAGDFRLKPGSPAIDSGLADTQMTRNVHEIYRAAYGLSIAKDLRGADRPFGDGWDIGAYEYGASSSGGPSTPRNLHLIK